MFFICKLMFLTSMAKTVGATFLLALYMIGLYTKGYRRIFADPQIAIL